MDNIWIQSLQRFVHHLLSCRLIAQKTKTTLIFLLSLPFLASASEIHPSCALYLEYLGEAIEAAHLPCLYHSLAETNACLQKHWLRQGERSQIRKDQEVDVKLAEVFTSYTAQLEPILPQRHHYHTVVLVGSSAVDMIGRLGFLLETQKRIGFTFDHLVALGCDRARDPLTENDQILYSLQAPFMRPFDATQPLPKDESALWEAIFDHSTLPPHWPRPVILNTYALPGYPRARTIDTIRTLQEHPEYIGKGPLLFISSQPFSDHQKGAIVAVLGNKVEFDMAAGNNLVKAYPFITYPPASSSPKANSFAVLNFQDMLARLTYQTLKNQEAGLTQGCPTLKKPKNGTEKPSLPAQSSLPDHSKQEAHDDL